jgi:hypothetical protein
MLNLQDPASLPLKKDLDQIEKGKIAERNLEDLFLVFKAGKDKREPFGMLQG